MKVLTWLLPALLLAACKGQAVPGTATVLTFAEQQPGSAPQRTRMLVNAAYVRIDDGEDGPDFLLFDRRQKVIYTTNSLDRRILVIKDKPVGRASPIALEHKIIKDEKTYPPLGGRSVTHYQYLSNGDRCYDVYVAEGLLPKVVAALREFRVVLAGEQAAALEIMPKEFYSACDLANNIFEPARHLRHGLPIRQRDMTGRTRELVDYKTGVKVDAALFVLPEGYRRFTMEQMRGG